MTLKCCDRSYRWIRGWQKKKKHEKKSKEKEREEDLTIIRDGNIVERYDRFQSNYFIDFDLSFISSPTTPPPPSYPLFRL